MSNNRPDQRRRTRDAQRGFTLVELLISILIGVFLCGGLVTLVGAMKRTSGAQAGMSQLQDNERMAMSLMAGVIQSTGYYINPTVVTSISAFPTTGTTAGTFTFAGQSIVGVGAAGAAAPGDSITVRYATAGGDGILDCTGNTSLVAMTLINQFSVDAATGDLICVLNGGAPVHLVGQGGVVDHEAHGVRNLQILYGVQTNSSVNSASIDTYLDAPSVTAGNWWGKVVSVKVTLYFDNPFYGTPGQTSAAQKTVPFTRIINVMNMAGVTT
jgi:type IV pilus assembly protein PilW